MRNCLDTSMTKVARQAAGIVIVRGLATKTTKTP
jgi:hypothetical protein